MIDPVIAELCGAVDATTMMAHLEEFARRTKLSGTPSELESFAYLQACLDGYGLRTKLIRHEAYISLPGKALLEVSMETPDSITHSFSQPSGPQGLRGALVYGGCGTADDLASIDVRGKIALLDGIANPAASLRASRAGAIGQLHVSPHEHLHEMCISPVWGSPTTERLDLLPKTVVLSVRKAAGDALKARLLSGEALEAVLHAEVDTGWRETPLLQADLDAAAPRTEDYFVMFSGHHDTWHYGVMDNGGANATMLEVARLFAQKRDRLKRGLRLMFWSGHSHGRYTGSAWYADTHWAELDRRCVAHVNVDSTGARGSTILADAQTSAELYGLAAEAVREQGGQDLAGHRMSRAGDQSFWGIGVPSVFMGMGEQPVGAENPMAAVFGADGCRKGAGFGWWWHTPDDTLDKMDPDLLVRDSRIYIHTLWRLVTDAELPLDIGRQADFLVRELVGLALDLGGRLDLAPVVASAEALRRRATAPGRGDAVRTNRALVAASRALVPIDYTTGDRFDHDPALGQSAYAVLDPVRRLAAAKPGTDASRFAAVAARRSMNRLASALDAANDALAALLPSKCDDGRDPIPSVTNDSAPQEPLRSSQVGSAS